MSNEISEAKIVPFRRPMNERYDADIDAMEAEIALRSAQGCLSLRSMGELAMSSVKIPFWLARTFANPYHNEKSYN